MAACDEVFSTYARMKQADLRDICRRNGIKVGGNRDELVARLVDYHADLLDEQIKKFILDPDRAKRQTKFTQEQFGLADLNLLGDPIMEAAISAQNGKHTYEQNVSMHDYIRTREEQEEQEEEENGREGDGEDFSFKSTSDHVSSNGMHHLMTSEVLPFQEESTYVSVKREPVAADHAFSSFPFPASIPIMPPQDSVMTSSDRDIIPMPSSDQHYAVANATEDEELLALHTEASRAASAKAQMRSIKSNPAEEGEMIKPSYSTSGDSDLPLLQHSPHIHAVLRAHTPPHTTSPTPRCVTPTPRCVTPMKRAAEFALDGPEEVSPSKEDSEAGPDEEGDDEELALQHHHMQDEDQSQGDDAHKTDKANLKRFRKSAPVTTTPKNRSSTACNAHKKAHKSCPVDCAGRKKQEILAN